MIATDFMENSVSNKRQKVTFRSYKNFCEADFVQDLQRAPMHIADIFDDVEDSYWAYETLLHEIVDEHAPQKQKYPKKDASPFMNSELQYRGQFIKNMFNFELHVSNICKKAAKQINVLCRLSHYLNTDTKLLIYKSFVRSNFSYCPLIWRFCSKTSTDKTKKLQYRALRLVYR